MSTLLKTIYLLFLCYNPIMTTVFQINCRKSKICHDHLLSQLAKNHNSIALVTEVCTYKNRVQVP